MAKLPRKIGKAWKSFNQRNGILGASRPTTPLSPDSSQPTDSDTHSSPTLKPYQTSPTLLHLDQVSTDYDSSPHSSRPSTSTSQPPDQHNMGSCSSKMNKEKDAEPPKPFFSRNMSPAPSDASGKAKPGDAYPHLPVGTEFFQFELDKEPRKRQKDCPDGLYNTQFYLNTYPDTKHNISKLPGRRELSSFETMPREFGDKIRDEGKKGWSEY